MYESVHRPDWKWFEDVVAYGNARLPQALLLAGSACGNERMLSAGLDSLELAHGNAALPGQRTLCARSARRDFTARVENRRASINSRLKPRARCPPVYRLTASRATIAGAVDAWSAFNWFLGDNDLQLPLYDSATGGCRDGLHPDRANQNQGAESTLSFLMALLEMRSLKIPEKLEDRS